MITRIWRGWTEPAQAAEYERLLLDEVFPGIAARAPAGYRGTSLGRRDDAGETEFVTIMWFDSLDDVKRFAGEEYDVAVEPPKVRALLARFDARSARHDVVVPPPTG